MAAICRPLRCSRGSGRLGVTGRGRGALRSRRSLASRSQAWPGAVCPVAGGRDGLSGEASVTAKTIPRHAGTSERQWPDPGPSERALPSVPDPGPELRLAQRPGPPDPLAGPVAITQRAVLGDQLRRPIAWCEMPACISRYDDPAAVGEADIRSRALAAGWVHDAIGRLVCPYCQQRNPSLWAAYPLARQHPGPAQASRQRPAHARADRIGTVRTTLSAWYRQVRDGLARRPRWPRLPAAPAGGDGPNTPTRPRHQRTSRTQR